MKIAIFENEYDSVRGSFETSNLLNFDNSLIFDVFPSSQNADLTKLDEYSAIFIDIDLSANSELDGFSLIQKIRKLNEDYSSKIIILTGNNKIKEIMKSRNIITNLIQILIKPTNYQEITNILKTI